LGQLFGTGWPEIDKGKVISFPNLSQNRHRGSGRPLSPATRPDMRVRIRRFGGLN
jgi:hypothetical protein